VKYLLTVLLFAAITSCTPTKYVLLGYDKPDTYYEFDNYKQYLNVDTSIVVYMLQRTSFPKTIRRIYTHQICKCVSTNDTVFFTREKDTLVIHKYK
jgi:hypothetical protein